MLTVRQRTAAEGLSFLTKTLPKLGKALDEGLESARLLVPSEFNRAHGRHGIPAFMQAYLSLVFDESGGLRDSIPVGVVKHIRQVCFVLYKLQLPYQAKQEARIIENFVVAESELEISGDEMTSGLLAAASYIIRDVLDGFDPKDIMPRHGPGSVATGERLEEKWNFHRLYDPIHQAYPYYSYYVVGGSREISDRVEWYKQLKRCPRAGRAKVVLVPKDSRGPRLISAEPLEYQYIQQGLGRKLSAWLEAHRHTAGQINFTDQTVNGRLAFESSKTREYATLDLKDASDRVSLELVKRLFAHSEILRYLLATRTSRTLLPDGREIELKKFAPMGSALCFPVEAFVFWALIVAGVHRSTGLPLSEIRHRVFVYGDDIIVPCDWTHVAIRSLESARLKVNTTKSYATGYFRESCGVDAYNGENVTPLRLKALWTGRWSDGSAFASYVALANHLGDAGYTSAADRVFCRLEKAFGKLPYVTRESGALGRWSRSLVDAIQDNHLRSRQRRETTPVATIDDWAGVPTPLPVSRPSLQCVQVWGFKLQPRRRETSLDGWHRLLKACLQPDEEPSEVVLPRSTRLKRGWTTIG